MVASTQEQIVWIENEISHIYETIDKLNAKLNWLDKQVADAGRIADEALRRC